MSNVKRNLRSRSSNGNNLCDVTGAEITKTSVPTAFCRRNKITGINDIVTNDHLTKIKLATDYNSERIKLEDHNDDSDNESFQTVVRTVKEELDLNFIPSPTSDNIFLEGSSVDNSVPDSVETLDRKSIQARIENLKNLAKQKIDEIAILTEDLAKLNAEIDSASKITFQCQVCDKSITAFENCCDDLQAPTNKENGPEISIKGKKQIVLCLICQKPFGSKRSRAVHNRIHVPKKSKEDRLKKPKIRKRKKRSVISKPVKTPYDPSKRRKRIRIDFNANPSLKIKRGPKSKPCPICGKIKIKGMAEHIRMHTGEKPFSCEFCNRKFVRSADLRQHRNTHTGERPYQCQVCLRTFTQRATLYNHRTVHAKEKAFSCDICHQRFTKKNTVKSHKIKIHGQAIAPVINSV